MWGLTPVEARSAMSILLNKCSQRETRMDNPRFRENLALIRNVLKATDFRKVGKSKIIPSPNSVLNFVERTVSEIDAL